MSGGTVTQGGALSDEQQQIRLYNDLNRTYGNTTKAQADNLWALGYRLVATSQPPATDAATIRNAALKEACHACAGIIHDVSIAIAQEGPLCVEAIAALRTPSQEVPA